MISDLAYSVINVMKVINVEVDDRDMEAFHRKVKLKGNSKKQLPCFCNRSSKRVISKKIKLASVNTTTTVGLGNNTKVFIS